MEHILFLAFLILISYALAKTEVQIEGPNGWAARLPAWRLPASHWVSALFFGGRSADGYHVWLFYAFIPLMLHAPFIYIPFSLAVELKIIAFLILFLILEDFLWFVVNPSFGIGKFRKRYIPWHARRWFWIAPGEYLFVFVGAALYIASYYLN